MCPRNEASAGINVTSSTRLVVRSTLRFDIQLTAVEMRLTNQFLTKAIGLVGSSLVRGWMGSLEFKAAQYDSTTDMISPHRQGPKIYVLWHEYMLFPLYLRGNTNTTLLISRHRDSQILSRVAFHLGFNVVRGSSLRDGVTSLRRLLRQDQMNLGMTCDGPRGPRRRLASGAIYLAAKLGLPIVVSAIGYDRPWRTNSWDRFAIPRPYSRARLITSPPIPIPPIFDRKRLEDYRVGVEGLLNQLTLEAEVWAEGGTARREEVALRRQPMARSTQPNHSPEPTQRAA
jgi:lysophospholipid acyltransferase (LPLAT)-like uncharacterized protein